MGCGSSTEPPNWPDDQDDRGEKSREVDASHIEEEPPKTVQDYDWLHKYRSAKYPDEDEEEEAEEEVTSRKTNETVDMMGRKTKTLDVRTSSSSDKTSAPVVNDGEVYSDPDFSFDVAMNGIDDAGNCQWQRPSEFCTNPVLFSDGTTRFDIEQGGAGTCWFLSTLAALAEHPECIQQILPEDAYTPPGSAGYNGVFHCRLWHFGEWQDVYCDDCLPVKSSLPWGARSTDANELWVSLMEKAFARYHGGYSKVYGGWSGDAFVALTGGVAERIETSKIPNKKEFFQRIKNSIRSGAVITCSCPKDKDGVKGLAGGHAYTITGSTKIKYNEKTTPLLRIRNPWGVGKGEWQGAWSDGSEEWSKLDEESKRNMSVKDKDDGEFWMTLHDYLVHYSDTCICNFTPDFDKDGCEDGLSRVSCVLGQWLGDSAAGSDVENKMKNPRFTFTVSKKGLDADNKLPVVLQIIQRTKRNLKQTNFYIRLDLYKIDHKEKKDGKNYVVLDEMTNYASYFGGGDYAYRYRLPVGDYLILPTTMEANHEREFCIRVFSSVELTCSEHKQQSVFFVRKEEPTFDYNGTTYTMDKVDVKVGEWKSGSTAGGQISNKTFHSNPQYTFTIKGSCEAPLMVDLLQENTNPKLPIGYKIYPLSQGMKPPLDLSAIYDIHSSAVLNIEGGSTFVIGWEGEGYHMVPPGDYLLVLFLEKPNDEKNFALYMASSGDIRLTRRR